MFVTEFVPTPVIVRKEELMKVEAVYSAKINTAQATAVNMRALRALWMIMQLIPSNARLIKRSAQRLRRIDASMLWLWFYGIRDNSYIV